MGNFTFIAFFGICIMSIASCQFLPENVVIPGITNQTNFGLNLGDNVDLSGNIKQFLPGNLVIPGITNQTNFGLNIGDNVDLSGNIKAVGDDTIADYLLKSGTGPVDKPLVHGFGLGTANANRSIVN